MRLVTHSRINQQYFAKGSRPSRAEWQAAIERGEVGGKVGMGKVWVDVDDFLARDFLDQPKKQTQVLDLLG
jgi:hypothetical protein